jgi:6-pyruvoyltetrahydropterin/6-carboxytetrahydropterin synthase
VVGLPFNPTAENMATYFLDIGPDLLEGTGARLVACKVQETGKCNAEAFFSE